MKKKELSNLREKTIKDLVKIVYEKKTEASNRNLRREVAQIETLIREKEIIEKLKK